MRSPGHRSRALVVATIVLVVAGCGTSPSPAPPTAPRIGSSTPTSVAPTAVPTVSSSTDLPSPSPLPSSSVVGPSLIGRLACSGFEEVSFPASALSGPADAELAQTVQALALRAFLTSAEGEGYPAVGWRIASSSTDRVDYLAPRNDGWWFVSVEDIPDQGGWQAWEYGECDPQVELPNGFGFASWVLDPANLPAADATSLTILATELACASGQPMAGRLTTPIVVETPDAVTIAVVVRTRPGDQDCQGNPSEPVLIQLAQPLGGRALFDGSAYPAERRR